MSLPRSSFSIQPSFSSSSSFVFTLPSQIDTACVDALVDVIPSVWYTLVSMAILENMFAKELSKWRMIAGKAGLAVKRQTHEKSAFMFALREARAFVISKLA